MSRPKTIKQRLESGNVILEAILQRRQVTGSPQAGWAIERAIVDRELRELEEQLSLDPAFPACEPVRFPPDIRFGARSLGLDLLRSRRPKDRPAAPPQEES